MSEQSRPSYNESYGQAPAATPARRWEPTLSLEAMLAIGFAFFVLAVIGYDVAKISAAKHVICAKFLAKGQADCGGGDGFREWAPMIVSRGLPLLAIELVLVPAVAYAVGRIVRSVRST